MALDFGEEGETKVALTIEASPGRPARVEQHELGGSRPLRRLEGTLEELRAAAPSVGDALCLVMVNTERAIPNLADQVEELLPEATVLQVNEHSSQRELQVLRARDASNGSEPTLAELFTEYVGEVGVAAGDAEAVVKLFERSVDSLSNDEEIAFSEVDTMRRPVAQEQP
jgi:exonuclease SbcD